MLAADSQERLEGLKATYMFNFHVRIINSSKGFINTPVRVDKMFKGMPTVEACI